MIHVWYEAVIRFMGKPSVVMAHTWSQYSRRLLWRITNSNPVLPALIRPWLHMKTKKTGKCNSVHRAWVQSPVPPPPLIILMIHGCVTKNKYPIYPSTTPIKFKTFLCCFSEVFRNYVNRQMCFERCKSNIDVFINNFHSD